MRDISSNDNETSHNEEEVISAGKDEIETPNSAYEANQVENKESVETQANNETEGATAEVVKDGYNKFDLSTAKGKFNNFKANKNY